jgi:hypothetical protein
MVLDDALNKPGAHERTPLLSDPESQFLTESDRTKVALLRQIAGDDDDTNPGYQFAVSFSVRAAIFASLMACIVWVPAFGKPLPPDIPAYMPLAIVLFFFTITPLLGSTIRNGIVGVWGTFLACFHMWVMQGVYPGGMSHSHSTGQKHNIELFGWLNMLAFVWMILWSKCGLGVKMFALSYDVGFMLHFLNPDSTLPFSENFTISSRGTAVNCMIATFIAVSVAVMANLVPWKQDLAFDTMRLKAMTVSHHSARLFLSAIEYYGGSSPSLAIVTMQEHEKVVQVEMAGLADAIDAAYFEGFDSGEWGLIRKNAENHHKLMLNVTDRLRAVMISLETEGFEQTHNAVMAAIKEPSVKLATLVQGLLFDATHAMSDGHLNDAEATTLRNQIQLVNVAIADLAKSYDTIRRRQGQSISEDLLGESFFVLTLSGYARLVVEFSALLLEAPPPVPQSITDDLIASIKSTFEMKEMMHEFNMDFTIRYFSAIVIAFFYCVYVARWNATCVVISSVLINFNVGTDILSMVNTLSAVILAGVMPPIVLNVTCRTSAYLGITGYLLPWVAVAYWLLCLYPYFSKSHFALLGILGAALGAFSLVGLCSNFDITKPVSANGEAIVHMAFAVIINACCEAAMSVVSKHRSSKLAIQRMDVGFEGLQESLAKFFADEDMSDALVPITPALAAGIGFNKNAGIEPRFWRIDWKADLYAEIVDLLGKVRLDLLMLQAGTANPSSESRRVLDLVNGLPGWQNVKDDLNRTLADGRRISRELLEHELGKFEGCKHLRTVTDIDVLEDLPALLTSLAKSLKFTHYRTTTLLSMEEDDICKISAVLVMLQSACAHMGQIVKVGVSRS